MEKCFGYFGVRTQKGLSSSLGLNDEQIQLQEMEDIERTMPDAQIVMIEPQPLGKTKFFHKVPYLTIKFKRWQILDVRKVLYVDQNSKKILNNG